MSEKSEALRLAEIWSDYLPAYHYGQVAWDTVKELRRLSAVEAQRDALLETLKAAIVRAELRREGAVDVEVIRAAIKQAEENK